MRVTAQDGTELELTYTSMNYFTVCKVSMSTPDTNGEALSEVLESKEYKHQLKTYAHVSGLVGRLGEWLYIVEDSEQLEKDLIREDGIRRAVARRKFKELNI